MSKKELINFCKGKLFYYRAERDKAKAGYRHAYCVGSIDQLERILDMLEDELEDGDHNGREDS